MDLSKIIKSSLEKSAMVNSGISIDKDFIEGSLDKVKKN